MAQKFYKGKFQPKNPSKYKGDPTKIEYRSSWELKVMDFLDKHPDVIEWGSEEHVIGYISPLDGRMHRYFVDFYVKKRNFSDNQIVTLLIEVKPKKQTTPPKAHSGKTKPSKQWLQEVATWGVNSAKWKAADLYCKQRGWKFVIITEDHLGLNKTLGKIKQRKSHK